MFDEKAYFAARYRANRALYIERAKARYRANPEEKHRYDKERRKRMNAQLRRQAKLRHAAKRGTSWAIWDRAKHRAKRDGTPFTITIADVVIPAVCPVLGIELKAVTTRGGHDASPSLDRIRPELGYVPGNVVVISKKANAMKQNGTSKELHAVATWLERLEIANPALRNGLSLEMSNPELLAR